MRNTAILLLFLAFAIFQSCDNDEDASDAYGNFESISVLVSAESQGKLISLNLEEGQHLMKGEKVGVIDTMQQHLRKLQVLASMHAVGTRSGTLKAQVNAQKVQLKNLEREHARIMKLVKDGAATVKQLDDLEGNIELVKAQIKSIESQQATVVAEQTTLDVQLKQIEDQITRAIITNPIEGVVLQKYKQAGEIVAPGQAVYKIANLDKLIVRAYISGNQLSSVKIGQQVTVRIDGPGGIEALSGKVTWVADEAEFTPRIIQTREERVNLVYAMKVEVENDGRLKIGMPAEIKF